MNTSEFIPIFPQTITLHQMISFVTDLETEVCASPMYDRTIAKLTKNPKKEKNTADILKQFTRSVIRLAFQRFITQPKMMQEQPWEFSNPSVTNHLSPDSTETLLNSESQEISADSQNRETLLNSESQEIPADSQNLLDQPEYPLENASTLPERSRRGGKGDSQSITDPSPANSCTPSKNFLTQVKYFRNQLANSLESLNLAWKDRTENQNQVELQIIQNQQQEAREHRLKQIGIKLRDARLSKSITIEQIHLKTAIASSIIEAIENGLLEKLPEAVYLQGYLRKIAKIVGLDGNALVKEFMNDNLVALPESDVDEMEPQDESSQSSKYQVTSTHLFFGYITLISGAIGLLSSMLHTADSQIYIPEVESDENQPPTCKDQYNPSPDRNPDLHFLDYDRMAIINISPPELL
jgi:cytoskeleton protein RodZ